MLQRPAEKIKKQPVGAAHTANAKCHGGVLSGGRLYDADL